MKPFSSPAAAGPVAFMVLVVSVFLFSGCALQSSDLQHAVDPPGMEAPPVESKTKPDVMPDSTAAVDTDAQPTSASTETADRPHQAPASREAPSPPSPPSPKTPVYSYPPKSKTRPLVTRGRESARSPSSSVAQTGSADGPAQTGQIVYNFDDADIYEVIRTMAELLNINYIVDPNVRGKVTIHTTGGFARDELFNVFFQILEASSLTAVKEGNLYSIVRLKDATRMPLDSRTGLSGDAVPADERVLIQIVPLQFISAQEMTKLLAPFVSAEGTIISHTDSKNLLVVDKKINISKMLRLVDVFDANVFEKVYHRFYTLEHTDAEEAAKTLTEVMASYGAVTKEEVKFVTIPRLNMLLVVSPTPQAFDTIQALLGQIDIPSLSIEPRIFVYAVKNSQAADLADLLTKVFTKKSAEKAQPADKAQPPGTRNPLLKTPPAKEAKPSAELIIEGTGSGTLKGEIRVVADEIRNALVIEATPRDYAIVEGILKRLDVLPRQVLIEVMIVEVTLSNSSSLGVEWSYVAGAGSPSTSVLSASAGSVTGGLAFAIGEADRWSATLTALASESKVNVLSAPTVLASDNKEAKIDISSEIPVASASYQYGSTTTDALLQTSIQYRNTGVILAVTPHINEFGLVSMDVNQEVSEPGEDVLVGGETYPSFRKRTVQTTLTVKHGQTIVIGGLIRDREDNTKAGVPCLINVPVLEYLFGQKTDDLTKAELIILITPRVITGLDDVEAITADYENKVKNVIDTIDKKQRNP